MRHGMAHKKLGRTSAHRSALFRNQLASLLHNERIITTLVKARELRPIVEKMITLGKKDSVHTRRRAARSIADGKLVQRLFDVVSPRFNERPGGYTRIIKLGPRRGDGAEMAILEFVDYSLETGAVKGERVAAKAAPVKPAPRSAPKTKDTTKKPKEKAAKSKEKTAKEKTAKA